MGWKAGGREIEIGKGKGEKVGMQSLSGPFPSSRMPCGNQDHQVLAGAMSRC